MKHQTLSRRIFLLFSAAAGAVVAARAIGQPENVNASQAGTWSATGTLLESCTCAVPCTCNFGEGPSPNHFCHAVFAYRLDRAQWDGVDLSGLVVAGADGPKGSAGFIDTRASAAQRPALEKMAKAIFAQGGPSGAARKWIPVAITHEVKDRDLTLKIGTLGGFTAKTILGRDGKTPIVVENNAVWPIARSVKGKSQLNFKDTAAGTVTGEDVNANYGAFEFKGTTSGN